MRRFVMIALTIIAQAVTAQAMASDTVLINGHIYTAHPAAPWAQAIAITGSRIDAVGDSGTVRGRAARLAQV
jgi:predicted amidohydrolase YtcJ